ALGAILDGTATADTVTFNDPVSLARLCYRADGTIVRAAVGTFVPGMPPGDPRDPCRDISQYAYIENGMTFLNGVVPRDPRLGFTPWPHYHLSYAHPEDFTMALLKQLDPANAPRVLSNHDIDAVIQMTYQNPMTGANTFNLISMEV